MYQTLTRLSMTGVTYGCDFAHRGPVSIESLHHPAPREGFTDLRKRPHSQTNSRTADRASVHIVRLGYRALTPCYLTASSRGI
jgi:hypothetical protein